MDRRSFIKGSLVAVTYVDFRSRKRTVKDSGLWYGRVAAANRVDVD
ncbi:MAG: hypothetical protein WBL61_26325 [Bryobacteraceae bacterium]